MAHNRMRKGLDPIESSDNLSHAANFLYMLQGEEPSEDTARLMDIDFVVHADHGCNASAFTTRVVTGTKADFYGSITAGIAANKPRAVAKSASAMPGATMAKLVFLEIAID